MMEKQVKPTLEQQRVIDARNTNMLVSASAGTGKTATMINRIVSLIADGVDVSEIVVVTFTNLAAAQMKNKLAEELSRRRDARSCEQLEKLDLANISTLHAFCSELLRNYFYVVDLDPAFTILDSVTVSALRKRAWDEVFEEYFAEKDASFGELYKILSTKRREDNFKKELTSLYEFGKCLPDFDQWYNDKRNNFVNCGENNPVLTVLLNDFRLTLNYCVENLRRLTEDMEKCLRDKVAQNQNDDQKYKNPAKDPLQRDIARISGKADILRDNAERLAAVRTDTLDNFFADIVNFEMVSLPRKTVACDEFESLIHANFSDVKENVEGFVNKCARLCRHKTVDELWREMQLSLPRVDKMAEVVRRFDEAFTQLKKQRGGVDFNDLEHLTLRLLDDSQTLAEIHGRYKQIFVDEYQDTNPVQEEIICRLVSDNNLFMVGDVKQSIYSFRGCEPDIFVQKSLRYLDDPSEGRVEYLNVNFRSSQQILDFVNTVFNGLMTDDFGGVDYEKDAQLSGEKPFVFDISKVRPVCVDILRRPPTKKGDDNKLPSGSVYDITADVQDDDGIRQGERIAERIKQYYGMPFGDSRIGYKDIVILLRGMTDRARDIYNTLIEHNIPVTAEFKVEGYSSKEVRDLINFLRVIDNPYNDIYLAGVCLVFGKLSEDELGVIRLDTAQSVKDEEFSFYDRLQTYLHSGGNGEIVAKIDALLKLIENLRFYAQSESVCNVLLELMRQCDYELYVRALPNGELRINKLYEFVDGIRGASYEQSVDKFLSYIDQTDEERPEEFNTGADAVRMMTMHASKGLDFPIVFVAGLETKFLFNGHAVEHNADLGVAMNSYDFDSMLYSPTLGKEACKILNQDKQRQEEMRLLYVALTRAKYALNLVATVDSDRMEKIPVLPRRAQSHFDWLHIALHDKYFDTAAALKKGVEIRIADMSDKIESNGANDESSSKEDCAPTDKPSNPVVPMSVEQVKERIYGFRYPYPRGMETKVVSSALDKEYIDGIRQDGETQPNVVLNLDVDRNDVGTAYHKVYQYVDYDADLPRIADTVARLVNDGAIEQRFADKLDFQLIYDTLRNPDFVRLLADGKVYHEIPFMLYVPYNLLGNEKYADNVMLQGVIDLLVLKKDRATVIDFKYTSHSDKVEENYAKQLNSYRLAVQNICGIDNVDCYVLSVADNKVIAMSGAPCDKKGG